MFGELIDENESCKTIFSLTGCILYQFQCIESSLSTLIAWKKLSPMRQAVDHNRWDHELTVLKEETTLGQLLKILTDNDWASQSLLSEIQDLLDFRNFLMHRYFKENSTVFCSLDGQQEMIGFLENKREIVEVFGKKLSLILAEDMSVSEEDIAIEMAYLQSLNEHHNTDTAKQIDFLKNKEGVEIVDILTNSPDNPEERFICFVTSGGQILTLGYDGLILNARVLRDNLKPFKISNLNLPQTFLPKKTERLTPWNYILHFKSKIKVEVSTHAKGYLITVK